MSLLVLPFFFLQRHIHKWTKPTRVSIEETFACWSASREEKGQRSGCRTTRPKAFDHGSFTGTGWRCWDRGQRSSSRQTRCKAFDHGSSTGTGWRRWDRGQRSGSRQTGPKAFSRETGTVWRGWEPHLFLFRLLRRHTCTVSESGGIPGIPIQAVWGWGPSPGRSQLCPVGNQRCCVWHLRPAVNWSHLTVRQRQPRRGYLFGCISSCDPLRRDACFSCQCW